MKKKIAPSVGAQIFINNPKDTTIITKTLQKNSSDD